MLGERFKWMSSKQRFTDGEYNIVRMRPSHERTRGSEHLVAVSEPLRISHSRFMARGIRPSAPLSPRPDSQARCRATRRSAADAVLPLRAGCVEVDSVGLRIGSQLAPLLTQQLQRIGGGLCRRAVDVSLGSSVPEVREFILESARLLREGAFAKLPHCADVSGKL